MKVYAESSAVLAWLLDEEHGAEVRRILSSAEHIVASDLTVVECDRVLIRAAALGNLTETEAADRRAHLGDAASRWHVLRMSGEVVDRARQPFPGEPIRTLDALHLASALLMRSAIAGLAVLSLDDRIRQAARRLGFQLEPSV